MQSYLTLEDESLSVTLSSLGNTFRNGDFYPHWHQGVDLEIELFCKIDPLKISSLVQVSTDELLILISAYSTQTRRTQFFYIDMEPSGETWMDITLVGSQLGGDIVFKVEICPSADTKSFSELAPRHLNSFAECEITIKLEGHASRVQVESFDFDGSIDYPKRAYWRIESNFPNDAESILDQELNSTIWISLNSLRERELQEQLGRSLLNAEFQVRLLTEALNVPGAVTAAKEEWNSTSEEKSSLVRAINSLVSRYFDDPEEEAVRLVWKKQESEIRARIQGATS